MLDKRGWLDVELSPPGNGDLVMSEFYSLQLQEHPGPTETTPQVPTSCIVLFLGVVQENISSYLIVGPSLILPTQTGADESNYVWLGPAR